MIYLLWIICSVYCIWRLNKRYKKASYDGVIGVSPGLDVLMVIMLAPLLASVDVVISWINMVKESKKDEPIKVILNEEDKNSIY